ncbi:LysR family transcriptional regulator [Companilactobacillus allii]|uniref:LysR family transcriptional regulator n=1 Tax=Companilactobacillus allii TaxID=1847728 RepID=A0A1P8Q2Z3_9LACO|nr:LysR family transcriptional regulator [Companilactobacillus allii]APX72228.1 LysR family transcriptional regulator [Companilactobacillus allii]USQ69321.1 LysR family transcriptional regulator [Companilactobacillus allii]
MEIRVLNYFLAIAREENITKAAISLNVTQPTLSRQLQQLEEELGVKLFEKEKRKMVLTNEGMLLKRRAQEIVSLTDKTVNEVSHKDLDLSGEITIGSGELKSVDTLSKIIVGFENKYPEVTFNVFSGNSEDIKNRMDQGMIDIALFLEPINIEKYDFLRMNVNETFGLLVRNDSKLAQKSFIEPKDLQDVSLIMSTRAAVNHELMNWFGNYQKKLKIISNYNLIYNSVKLVQNGLGAMVCLKLDVNYQNLVFVPLRDAPILNSVVAWHSGQVFSRTTTAFVEYLKNCLQ